MKSLSQRRKEQQIEAGRNVQKDIAEIMRLEDEGKSLPEIAQILKKPESVVRILLRVTET